MSGFSVRLTHKVMAIGIVGLTGLLAFAAIYQAGSWSQDASRTVAKTAQGIADLNKQLSIEMLEARRNEKNFQQRRNETYAKAHAELVVKIDRDFDRLEGMTGAANLGALTDKVKLAHDGFKKYAADFAGLVSAELKLGLNETLGLSGALRSAVHDIETKLKEIDDPRLTSWMLMMRRNEKDFMLRRDPNMSRRSRSRPLNSPRRFPWSRFHRRSRRRSLRSWRPTRRSSGPGRRRRPRLTTTT